MSQQSVHGDNTINITINVNVGESPEKALNILEKLFALIGKTDEMGIHGESHEWSTDARAIGRNGG